MHWAAFGFCLSRESVAFSQCTIVVVVASGLVERVYIRLRLVIT